MAVLTIAFLLHAASAVHPPPAVCCEGEAASVTWVVNGSSPGMWCFQMLYSAENYMGCAALRSCERNGHEIWLTCPDGYETDSGTPLRLKRSVSRGDLNYLTMLSGLLQHIIGEWQPQGGNNGKYQWNTIFYLPIHQFYRTCAWGAGRNPDVWWCYPPFFLDVLFMFFVQQTASRCANFVARIVWKAVCLFEHIAGRKRCT